MNFDSFTTNRLQKRVNTVMEMINSLIYIYKYLLFIIIIISILINKPYYINLL